MSHFHSEINQEVRKNSGRRSSKQNKKIKKRREFKFYDHDNVSARKLVEDAKRIQLKENLIP